MRTFALCAGLILSLFATPQAAKQDLNAEVLAKVIAKKQEELKQQLVRRLILKSVGAEKIDDADYLFFQSLLDLVLTVSNEASLNDAVSRETYRHVFKRASENEAFRATITPLLKDLIGAKDPSEISDSIRSLAIGNRIPTSKLIARFPKVWEYLKKTYGLDSKWGVEAVWVIDEISHSIVYEKDDSARIDAIALLTVFQQRYSGMANKLFEPVLNVGLNYTATTDDDQSQYGFASEKVGFKIKFPKLNYKYLRSQSRGSRTNLYREDKSCVSSAINDVHAIFFGSGILYNITPLPNYPSPKSIFGGAGLGVTFVNGLDWNLYYAVPFNQGKKNWYTGYFVGFGFDIEVGEYLGALKETVKSE